MLVYQRVPQKNMDVSENRPLNPMVLLIIIPFLNGYFIGNIPYFQTNPFAQMLENGLQGTPIRLRKNGLF